MHNFMVQREEKKDEKYLKKIEIAHLRGGPLRRDRGNGNKKSSTGTYIIKQLGREMTWE